jgi:hypothetical protein
MMQQLASVTGIFFLPQLALSVAVVSLVVGYVVASLRGELSGRDDKPWKRTLDPLASVSVSLGLLGSVWSFTKAFGGFQGGIDIDVITAGLGTAYATTGVGLVTSLIASLGSYLLGLAHR